MKDAKDAIRTIQATLTMGALLGAFGIVTLCLLVRAAFAQDVTVVATCPPCVCPDCTAIAAPPSPEQVQAVQRAYDAIRAAEVNESLPLGAVPAALPPDAGPAALPPLDAP